MGLGRLGLGPVERRLGFHQLGLEDGEFGGFDLDIGLGGAQGGLSLGAVGLGLVEILTGSEIGGRQLALAREVEGGAIRFGRGAVDLGLGGGDARGLLGDLLAQRVDVGRSGGGRGIGGIGSGLVGRIVDAQQDVARAHHLVVGHRHRGDRAFHLGADRGDVGLDIGVVGRDQVAGQEQPSGDADHDQRHQTDQPEFHLRLHDIVSWDHERLD